MKTSNSVPRSLQGLLIYPKFQLWLIGVNLAIMSLVAGCTGYLVHRSFVGFVIKGTAAMLPPKSPYFDFMVYQEKIVLAYLAAGLAIGVLLSSVAILVLSHRLAGPIVRMKGYFSDVAHSDGHDFPELRFREGDFFSELPDEVNAAFKVCGRRDGVSNGSSEEGSGGRQAA